MKVVRSFIVLVILVALIVIPVGVAQAAPIAQASPPAPVDLPGLLAMFLSLAGIGAFFAVLINVGKKAGWVKDGDAPAWSMGLNLLGMIALWIVKQFFPSVDVLNVDSIAGQLAQIMTLILGLVVQFAASKGTHAVVKGMPLIGYSYPSGNLAEFIQPVRVAEDR